MAGEVERGRDVDRVSAFSDGVFAIAITLLALTIRLPSNDEQPIGEVLSDVSQPVLIYFLSFWVIASYWRAHHRMWHFIDRVDGTFIVLNLVLLSFVALIPFPTDLVGVYSGTSEAAIVYALAVAATGLASATVWAYAARDNGMMREEFDPGRRHLMLRRALIAPMVFLASVPIAIAYPTAAMYSWLLIIPGSIWAGRGMGSVYDV